MFLLSYQNFIFRNSKYLLFSITERNMDIRGAYDKFPDFFHMGTFIDSTHMKL